MLNFMPLVIPFYCSDLTLKTNNFTTTVSKGMGQACGILGQVWYLIVSIPDLCRLSNLKAIFGDLVPKTI